MASHNFVPLNLTEEKKKFFFDPNYNPQFIYEQDIPDSVLYRHGTFGGELSDKAKIICDTVIKKWGTQSKYLDEVEGKVLSKEESSQIINAYLKECSLENIVSLHYSQNFIPRTSIDGYKMNIRLPIAYRDTEIIGMLHHEIGTHIYRRLNDENKFWHEKREKFELKNHIETEEGLAVLNGHYNRKHPYLWNTAVRYLACAYAGKLSFAKTYKAMTEYIDDRERRFNMTLRAKRGLTDTSKPGGYTKDQVYLRGVMKVSKWLKDNDFDADRLYVGKVAIEDLERLEPLLKTHDYILPPFLIGKKDEYKKALQELLEINFGSK